MRVGLERFTDVLFVGLLGVLLFAALVSMLVFRRLKTSHPEVWESLGKPTALQNASIGGQGNIARFLWGGRYRTLNDTRLNTLALLLKALGVSALLLFALGVVASFRA
jgi:hypothetical protein